MQTRKKKHQLSDGFVEKLDFLENVGFLKELETSYPDVKMVKEWKYGKVHRVQLKGRGDNFHNACKKCDDVVHQISESSQRIEDPHLYQMVATKACIDHLNNMMKSEGIQATVKPEDTAKSTVLIKAINPIAWVKAERNLKDEIIVTQISVPSNADMDSESVDFRDFQTKEEKGKILKIHLEESCDSTKVVKLVGAKDDVVKAKISTETFIESKRKKEETITFLYKVSTSKLTFLEKHFSTMIKPDVESRLKHLNVLVDLETKVDDILVHVKGFRESFSECENMLQEFFKEIVEKDKTFALPSGESGELFLDECDGQKQLERIGQTTKAYISKIDFPHVMLKNVAIVLKKGNITKYDGDVIINLLPRTLKLVHGGGVCNSVLKAGGQTIQQELDKPAATKDASPGCKIIYTNAGSIKNMKKILHFLPKYYNVQSLQDDVESCLHSAQQNSFHHVLIPAIGTAKLNMKPEQSAELILNATMKFSTTNYPLTLYIVIFEEKMLPIFEKAIDNMVTAKSSYIILRLVGLKKNIEDASSRFEDFFKHGKDGLPLLWDSQPTGKKVQLIRLHESSSEYKEILKHFNEKGGQNLKVKKIERIQNPALYGAYIVKKNAMKGEENEKRLFHGTDVSNIDFINTDNFNRSFAGANAALYGNGVYFARDASYSVRYCQSPKGQDLQMYVAKVLVGKYTLGVRGMKAPPPRSDPKNPGLRFDSLVNDMKDPSIFVVFQDHQCYPEYLISFEKKK